MRELHWADSSNLFRPEVGWTLIGTNVMSDLADAVFGGQLLGHVVAGQELTTSLIADAAIKADLATDLVVDDDLSSVEYEILQAKVAGHIVDDGHYSQSSIVADHIDAGVNADIAEGFV